MRSIVTLSGIDEAINNLGYTNEKHIKTRVIRALRQFYSDEHSIRTITRIEADDLIKSIWDTDNSIEAIKSKRKNFSSIKSSINSELTRLHSEGKNPEGIIIGKNNTFDMSDKAKSELLENFSGSGDSDNIIPLGKINDVLGIINDIFKKKNSGTDINSTEEKSSFEQLKELIQSISEKIGISYNHDNSSNSAPNLSDTNVKVEVVNMPMEAEDLEEAEIEEVPDGEIEEIEEPEGLSEDVLEEADDIQEADELEEVEGDIEEVDELPPEEEIADDVEIVEADEDLEEAEIEEIPDSEVEEIEEPEGLSEDVLEEAEDIQEADDLEEVEDDIEEVDELPPEEEIADDVEIVEADEDLEEAEIEEVPDGEIEEIEEPEGLSEDVLEEAEDIQEAEKDYSDEERLLADEFNNMLSEMDRYFNQYILIPKGTYLYGGRDTKRNGRPVEYVDIRKFYFGKFPVTNALFEIFIEKTGYLTTAEKRGYGTVYYGRYQNIVDHKTGQKTLIWNSALETKVIEGACWYQPAGPGSTLYNKRNHPVVQVSLEDAMAFARWTGKKIPTEAQWEAATRTLKGCQYPWGKEYRSGYSNIEDSYIGDTTPVDKYPEGENSLGIMDILGNVMEWTVDVYNPSGDKHSSLYILKGGSWISGNDLSLYDRSFSDPDATSNILGFRCIAY